MMFDRLAMRNDFVEDELLGRIANLFLFISKVLRGKYVVLVCFCDQIFCTFE